MYLLGQPTCRRTTRTIFTINLWASQFAGLLWGTICSDLLCTDSLHGFLRGFLHGCFAWIFFVRSFARIFCTYYCTIFLRIFLHGSFARIFARIFCKDFCKDLKRQNFTEKPPQNFTMLWGPSGEVLWRQEGEVGVPMEEVPEVATTWTKISKGKIKIMPSQGVPGEGAWVDHEPRSWVVFQIFQVKKIHRKSPLHPGLHNTCSDSIATFFALGFL